ncbi:MAG TPA: YceI family protein [Solirubrobacteraceae bacterium]|nr:YceI family protein [Solirubrobacteraceae bacterium]
MGIQPGTFELGPQDGTLIVRTGKGGAASKAGHNLRIQVERWGATVQFADDLAQSVLELTADSTSFTVLEGTGGVKSLDADDKAGIAQTINQEVLKGTPISFRSTAVRPDADDRLHVTGDLELANGVNLIAFDVTVSDDGQVTGTATVKQTEWGMKPYSALFGTLKVTDEVGVDIDAKLRPAG